MATRDLRLARSPYATDVALHYARTHPKEWSEGMASDELYALHASLAEWQAAGCVVVELPGPLVEALRRLDLSKLPLRTDYLIPPYPAWYVHAEEHPTLAGVLWLKDRRTGGEYAQVFVREGEAHGGTVAPSLFVPMPLSTWTDGDAETFVSQHVAALAGTPKRRYTLGAEDGDAPTDELDWEATLRDGYALLLQTLYLLRGKDATMRESVNNPKRKAAERTARRFQGTCRGRPAQAALETTYSRARVTRLGGA